jgi:ABC-type Fe3+ transport system substrate-binding protein
MTTRRISSSIALVGVTALLAACGGSDTGPSDSGSGGSGADPAGQPAALASDKELEELADVIESAREEGVLRLNWGGTGLADMVPEAFDRFNEYYGLDLELQHTPKSSMSTNASTLSAEYEAGRPAETDVAFGASVHVETALREGWVDPLDDWKDWSTHVTEDVLAGFADEPPVAIALYTLYGGAVYNTDIVTEELRTPQDILDLEHPIAATPIGAMFDRSGGPWEGVMGNPEIFEFLDAFEPKIEGLISCGDIDRVASGEFPVLFIGCSQASYQVYADKGAPVAFTPIEGMAIAQQNYMYFPEHAKSPNVARLWANYLMTPEAQELVYDYVRADNSRLEGSQTKAELDEWESQGYNYVFVDMQANRDMNQQYGPEYRKRILSYFQN